MEVKSIKEANFALPSAASVSQAHTSGCQSQQQQPSKSYAFPIPDSLLPPALGCWKSPFVGLFSTANMFIHLYTKYFPLSACHVDIIH